MAEYFDNVFQEALNNNVDRLTDAFAKSGNRLGWPQDLVNNIKVDVSDGNISLAYDNSMDDVVMSLEYGAVGQHARPAIRQFTNDAGDDLNEILAEYGVNAIFSRGILP